MIGSASNKLLLDVAKNRKMQGQQKMENMTKKGRCDTCGDWNSDLVSGMCKPCRDKYLTRR